MKEPYTHLGESNRSTNEPSDQHTMETCISRFQDQLTLRTVEKITPEYVSKISSMIAGLLNKPSNTKPTYDLLETMNDIELKHSLRHKQSTMKRGQIWQIAIGNYGTFEDLLIGHSTGLDVMSTHRKIAIELKNRTNTDNASSKKTNMDKLVRFKKQNPDYECIYGLLNDCTEEKTRTGSRKPLQRDGVEIMVYTGMELLHHVFGDDATGILHILTGLVKKEISIENKIKSQDDDVFFECVDTLVIN